LIGYYIQAVRWRHLLGKIPPISYTFHTMNVSTFTNLLTFIPTTPVRIFFMGEYEGMSVPQSASSLTIAIVFDWVMKIIALLGAVILLAPIGSNVATIVIFIGLIILIFAGMILLVHNIDKLINWATPLLLRLGFLKEEQVEGLLSGITQGLEEVRTTRKIALIFLYSLISWTFFIGFYTLGLLAFNIDPPPEVMLATVLVAAFFVNPTGPYLPGLFNVLLVVPMALVSNISIDALAAYSIVIYAILLVIWLVLGYWAMRQYKLSLSELKERAQEGFELVRQAREEQSSEILETQ
jgi:ABC-type multidrug transport system fused ATPase/permease subunit